MRSDREYACMVAVRRCLSLILATPKEDSDELWGGAIREATAELAVSRALGWFWMGEEYLAPTLPREIVLTVGWFREGTDPYPVYKPAPNSVHVFVEEIEPLTFDIVGWASGVVCARREYRSRGGSFNVPRAALHDAEALLASIKAEATLATE